MDDLTGHVMTLANSIIGVSILAMPYCFKQCGIILSICILLISSIISRLSCHFLLKSAIIARRKTFEFLAFHIFGSLGKFCIEIGMIGFLIGTCIAFFVVMGDLGPEIVSEMTGARTGNALRNSVLVALAVLCVLPLGLLRNVDSLNGVSKATIGFYCCLVLKIIIEALPHIFTGDWVNEVVLWRPQGILQCLPIFSMALFCQTQLFEIYQALPNASLEKMNGLIRVAVNICTWVYIFVGTFGYIGFFQKPFSGNILLSFRPSAVTDLMKIGFVLSLAFSFPLVIFPCRASLYSLLYKGPNYTILHEGGTANHIPEGKFKMLTFIIISVSLIIGIMIPNIELVLGLVGSTIGVMICVLFPVTCFICISPKNTNERILAQIMLFVGVIVMVLGTYANLYAFEEAKLAIVTEKSSFKNKADNAIIDQIQQKLPLQAIEAEKHVILDIPTTIKILVEDKQKHDNLEGANKSAEKPNLSENFKEIRHEPPQPEEPNETQVSAKPDPVANVKKEDKNEIKEIVINKPEESLKKEEVIKVEDKQEPVVEPVVPLEEVIKVENKQEPVVEPVVPLQEEKVENKPIPEALKLPKVEVVQEVANKKEEVKSVGDTLAIKQNFDLPIKEQLPKKNDEVDIEAIKKEDTELKEQEKEKVKETQVQNQQEKDKVKEVQAQNQILIDTIQKQNEVQKEIVEQQKKLIEVIEKQQKNSQNQDLEKIVKEEKIKAVQQIKDIAEEAIEKISGQDAKMLTSDLEKNNVENNSAIKLQSKEEKPDLKLPLSYQLGLNEEKNENVEVEANKIKLVPLPIALANNLTKITVKSIDLQPDNKLTNATKENGVKSIRRDILSEDDGARIKRDVPESETEQIKKLNKAVKEVCDEVKKLTSTEKPVIKMLCKLSEPSLVQIDTKSLHASNTVPASAKDLPEKHLGEI